MSERRNDLRIPRIYILVCWICGRTPPARGPSSSSPLPLPIRSSSPLNRSPFVPLMPVAILRYARVYLARLRAAQMLLGPSARTHLMTTRIPPTCRAAQRRRPPRALYRLGCHSVQAVVRLACRDKSRLILSSILVPSLSISPTRTAYRYRIIALPSPSAPQPATHIPDNDRANLIQPRAENTLRLDAPGLHRLSPAADRGPGARQRACKKRPPDGAAPRPRPPERKRKTSSSSTGSTTVRLVELARRTPELEDQTQPGQARRSLSSSPLDSSEGAGPFSQHRHIQPHPHPRPSASSSAPLRIMTDLYKYAEESSPEHSESASHAGDGPLCQPFAGGLCGGGKQAQQRHSPLLRFAPAAPHPKFPPPPAPAIEANQRASRWWTSFLEQYPLDDVAADLTYLYLLSSPLLPVGSSKLCFMTLPLFLDVLWSPEGRLQIQPALVLAGLAMAELMRASDAAERGASGRTRAAWLRENAQSALQTAVVDAALVEAALILVLYESSAHPQYHPDRIAAALRLLDEILQTVGVATLDEDDPHFTRFAPGAGPIVSSVPLPHPTRLPHERRCTCACTPQGAPPLGVPAPLRWDPRWSATEVRDEECRRLAWSALSLASAHLVQCAAFARAMPELALSDPANYAVLFPGEVSERKAAAYRDAAPAAAAPSPKESLYQALEDALEAHTCEHDAGVAYLTREYIYKCVSPGVHQEIQTDGREECSTRMSVAQALRTMQGLSRAPAGPRFTRTQAREWVQYQTRMIERVKRAASASHIDIDVDADGRQAGGLPLPLARRPFQVAWFLKQLAICMQLLRHDPGLADAVALGTELLGVVDGCNALYPCADITRLTTNWSAELYPALRAVCRLKYLNVASNPAGVPRYPKCATLVQSIVRLVAPRTLFLTTICTPILEELILDDDNEWEDDTLANFKLFMEGSEPELHKLTLTGSKPSPKLLVFCPKITTLVVTLGEASPLFDVLHALIEKDIVPELQNLYVLVDNCVNELSFRATVKIYCMLEECLKGALRSFRMTPHAMTRSFLRILGHLEVITPQLTVGKIDALPNLAASTVAPGGRELQFRRWFAPSECMLSYGVVGMSYH
ncbi:hypothetical protein B0H15DRAFT_993850 [Mycena belliarum]|uniref:Uncharacterized protein n=1 Tax=Mycena belliarum TaxID=1033014 RepID=A0AAD6XMZ8_9AGAR|nr:hypothetical protein B0H15DRAFT_993850 [Mycena belliae]